MSENQKLSQSPASRMRPSSVEKAAARLDQLGAGVGLAVPVSKPSANNSKSSPISKAPHSPDDVEGTRRSSRSIALNLEAMHAAGLVTLNSERSVIAEEFRLIKRPLLVKAFAEGEKKIPHGNLIMVTSARPGDGKTFCSVNLAMSIALERDLTVMLIDADVIKPGVASTLGIEAERGLIDVIADDRLDLSEVLLRTNVERLTVLPAGRSDPLATELIASDRMIELVDEIATRYPDRVVIFDSPPVLMNTIPAVLAPHVGQILFVVQADSSTQAAVDAGLGMISACNNISLLLNKARDLGGSDRFGKYGTYYGYER